MRKGFTLIELLLVIIILSILISSTAPRFGRSREILSLRQTAYRIREQIRYARRLSVMTGHTLILNVDADQGTLVLKVTEGDSLPEPFKLNPKGDLRLPAGTHLQTDRENYSFYATGSTEPYSIEIQSKVWSIQIKNIDSLGRSTLIESET